MKCKECGAEIVFSYITPDRSYRIEDNKIVRDDPWEGPEYDDPYLDFHCSNDMEHDINTQEVDEWADKITELFFKEMDI